MSEQEDHLLRAFLQSGEVEQELTPETVKFEPGVGRRLAYHEPAHTLLVSAPFTEKEQLKALGGIWRRDNPKGWSWYMTEKNLALLLDKIPFTNVDEKIEQVIMGDRERKKLLSYYATAHERSDPVCLRVPGLKTAGRKIRDYQKLGILFGSNARDGYLCGDEMGLGKTLCTIAVALWRKAYCGAKRCLVIVPASVKFNWRDELKIWSDEPFTIIHGPPKKRALQWKEKTFFKVVNTELVVQDRPGTPELNEPWDLIIFDEVHAIKRWSSKRSMATKELKLAPNGLKIGLSGTPIDGHLEDLQSVFEFLIPGLLPNAKTFRWRYTVKDEYGGTAGYKNVEELNDVISPFFIRRLKKYVAKDLPEKIFKAIYVDLSGEEEDLYKDLVQQRHHITCDAEAMTVVLRARQFCDSPSLLDMQPVVGAKLKKALELLDELISSGQKILLFTMFEKMVRILKQCCDERGWKYSTITGETPMIERADIARRFNEDTSVDICVMDEAGSTGLNFQAATYVIHYDDNWSPAIMKQRTDRAHRITTTHPVTVINLVCSDTIEEKRVRLVISEKDQISAAALGDDFQDVAALGPTLTSRELLKLL